MIWRAHEAAIMHERQVGCATSYAVELAAMEELGCSWPELQATPAGLVQEALERRSARLYWQQRRRDVERAKAKVRSTHG